MGDGESADTTTGDASIAGDDVAIDAHADASIGDDVAIDAHADASIGTDATVDATDSVPDGASADGGSSGPMFPTCVFSALLGGVPLAIAEVTQVVSGAKFCHCSYEFAYAPGRILCGSFNSNMYFIAPGNSCSPDPPPPPPAMPAIMMVETFACPANYAGRMRPTSDWDALLAEQIAGHADGATSGAGPD